MCDGESRLYTGGDESRDVRWGCKRGGRGLLGRRSGLGRSGR